MKPPRMLIGLIGANIMGSLSPALFADAFAAAGIDGFYHLIDVDRLRERRLPQLLDAIKVAGFSGTNITYPFKQDILPLLDAVDSEASQIGAINTIAIAPDGRTTGYNFDRRGWRRSFEESLGRDSAQGATVVQIGAGGAGHAVAFALMDLGVALLVVHDLDGVRAISSARSRQLTVSSMRRRWACGAFPAIRCRYPRSNQRIGLPTSSTPRSTRNSSSPRRRKVRASSAVTGCACTRRSKLSGSSPGSRQILRGFTVRLLPATGRVRLRSAKQFDSARPKDKTMKTSIATVCLSGGLSEKLQSIAAAGFRGVEIFESDLLSSNGTPADVAREMVDLGLRAITFQPFRDFEGMPEPQRQRTFERAERKFDLMQELGCDSLLVCSNVSPDSLGGIDRSAADFHELGERAAKRKLRVGFEALAWGRHINDYRDAWEVVRRANHPAIGLVLDSFHTFARKT